MRERKRVWRAALVNCNTGNFILIKGYIKNKIFYEEYKTKGGKERKETCYSEECTEKEKEQGSTGKYNNQVFQATERPEVSLPRVHNLIQLEISSLHSMYFCSTRLGSKVSGTVVDVCDFGAFISIGYATRGSRAGSALLHISQIQNKKISNIRDVIKVGDSIEGARVISVDLKKGEVGLSLRSRRPKRREFTKLKVGDQVEGKVASVVPYGVFVDVGANVNALLHISRINGGAIENVRHHLNEGDPVSVHVIDMDKEKKTMAVSMLDKKADMYLDRRMSQRLKRFYGTAASEKADQEEEVQKTSDLDYFDQAIRELEDALRDRGEAL